MSKKPTAPRIMLTLAAVLSLGGLFLPMVELGGAAKGAFGSAGGEVPSSTAFALMSDGATLMGLSMLVAIAFLGYLAFRAWKRPFTRREGVLALCMGLLAAVLPIIGIATEGKAAMLLFEPASGSRVVFFGGLIAMIAGITGLIKPESETPSETASETA